jgi:outer membrane protein OmpA-like peptidoglycan-associated protein
MIFKTELLVLLTLIGCSHMFSQCPESMITSEYNLIVNGDFEDSTINFETDYKLSQDAGAGRFRIVRDANQFSPQWFIGKGDNYFMAVDGAEGSNKVVWQQTIKVKPHTEYFFSIWTSTIMETRYGAPAVLQFSINNDLLDAPFLCPNMTKKWMQFFTNWNSENNETISIKIVSQNPHHNGNDFGLDRIKFYECTAPDFDEQLKEARVGVEIDMRDIEFEAGKGVLKPESFEQLDRLIDYLVKNPGIVIEIAGHTDNIGNTIANQILSEFRAKSVAEYLNNKGINESRYVVVGYGESQPLSTNETMEGRQINRRVAIKILSM